MTCPGPLQAGRCHQHRISEKARTVCTTNSRGHPIIMRSSQPLCMKLALTVLVITMFTFPVLADSAMSSFYRPGPTMKTKKSQSSQSQWNGLNGMWGKRSGDHPMDTQEYTAEDWDRDELTAGHGNVYGGISGHEVAETDDGMVGVSSGGPGEEDEMGVLQPAVTKRAWKSLNGAWGKRALDLNTNRNNAGDFQREPNNEIDNQMTSYVDRYEGLDENRPTEKRAWKSLNGAWGKRRAANWNGLKGLWGKRSSGGWNKLNGSWGKRSDDQLREANN